jgi:Tol biopolymer transport system component
VFQSEREPGNPFFQIYLMDLETGDVERLSPGYGKTTCAWLHPAGAKALFSSTHLDPDVLAKQEREIEAREAGTQRRYSWDFDEHYDIFAVDLESGELERLTDAPGYDAEASYSPDGTLVAFASNRHAYLETLSDAERARFEADPSSMAELYLMEADGSNVRRLTRSPGYDGGPFFSPDGERIVWRRFSEQGDAAEIFTMKLDGSDVRQLTRLGALSWAPFYHPSGEYVIFATNLHGYGNFELYLVDAEGRSEPTRVTDSPGFDGLPVFSPDGARLAWTSARTPDGSSQLFLADWHHEAVAARTPGAETAARTAPSIRVHDLRRHVEELASARMEGRLTGTEGERLATEYVAAGFAEAGLEPAGEDGGFFQEFEFAAGVSLGSDNELRLLDGTGAESTTWEVEGSWRPLAFSQVGAAPRAPVAFAGYGIVAPASPDAPAYDSYGGLDVEGRWVLVLRSVPEDISPERRQHLHRYASLRHKAMVARDRGAIGLIVVSGPNSKFREPLVRLGLDASAAGMSLFGLSVSKEVAAALLLPSGRTLQELQDALDQGEPGAGFELDGVALEARVDLVQERRRGRNVLGRLRAGVGADPAPLVVGAHVDHLGLGRNGNSLAREEERGEIHYGADDNASGVAAVLEIAAELSAAARAGQIELERDVIFAAWSGEEIGLLGSAAFVEDLPNPSELPQGAQREFAAYLNLDMVGRLDGELIVYGVGSSSLWPREIERRNAGIGLPISTQDDSYLPTDATSFYLKGVPVLSPFTGVHDEYHTPRDSPERLNYEGLESVAHLVVAIASSLASQSEIPDYVQLERPENLGARAGLRAYLGTIPRYTEAAVPGLELSGVARGGPAEKAGLRAGDVIVELAGRTVENIYDYTYALDALKVGEPVEIAVLRDGERIVLTVTPESRE